MSRPSGSGEGTLSKTGRERNVSAEPSASLPRDALRPEAMLRKRLSPALNQRLSGSKQVETPEGGEQSVAVAGAARPRQSVAAPRAAKQRRRPDIRATIAEHE